MRHLVVTAVALLLGLTIGLLVGAPAATALASGASPDGPGTCCRS